MSEWGTPEEPDENAVTRPESDFVPMPDELPYGSPTPNRFSRSGYQDVSFRPSAYTYAPPGGLVPGGPTGPSRWQRTLVRVRRRRRRTVFAAGVLVVLVALGVVGAVTGDHGSSESSSSGSGDPYVPPRQITVPAFAALHMDPPQVDEYNDKDHDGDPAFLTATTGEHPVKSWEVSADTLPDAEELDIDIYQMPAGRARKTVQETLARYQDNVTEGGGTDEHLIPAPGTPKGWIGMIDGPAKFRFTYFMAAQGDYVVWASYQPGAENVPDDAIVTTSRAVMKAITTTGVAKFAEMTRPQ